MSDVAKIENLEELLIELRGENILLDADVAVIYGVETKRVNEAIKNNPDKFPQGYMFELDEVEFSDLRSKISTAKFAKTRVVPKAFTEKGLYMLATILKVSKRHGNLNRIELCCVEVQAHGQEEKIDEKNLRHHWYPS